MSKIVLQKGDLAPQFTLENYDKEPVSLLDFLGRKLVLYFYPAASTPGCTTQACDFRDNTSTLSSSGLSVVGVSRDHTDKLTDFAKEQNLNFPLLSDPDLQVHNAYGVFGEKSMYGKKVTGVIRSTFVINEAGVIEHAMYNVKASGHVASLTKILGLLS